MIDHPTSPKPSLRRYIAPAIITAFIIIAIVIGLAPRSPKGNFIQSSEFQLAMDRAPSGQSQPLPGRMTLTPIKLFRDNADRFCREFTLSGAIEGGGIVCRQDGEWLIEGRSDPGASSDAELGAVYERLGASGPLDAATESRVIAAGWRD